MSAAPWLCSKPPDTAAHAQQPHLALNFLKGDLNMAEQKIYYSIRRTPEGAACAVFAANDDDGGDLSLLANLDVSMLLTYRDHEPPLPIPERVPRPHRCRRKR